MNFPVVLQDLSPHTAADPAEDQWLARLAEHLTDDQHVIRLSDRIGRRADDEDDAALSRGPDGKWWAGRYIGELRFEDRELRIEPRLGIDVIGAWLAHALNVTAVPNTAAKAANGPLIVQIIDRVWSSAVADAARHGTPRLRRTTHHDHVFVRGRVDIAGTVRHRAANRPLMTMVRNERDLHNPVSRVLVLADRVLRSLLPVKPSWRPALTETVLGQLRGAVGAHPQLPDRLALRGVRYTPISRRYQRVAQLSYEIARRQGHFTSATSSDVSGVLIDVAELWELFLLHSARKAFGPSHVEHGTAERDGAFLLQSSTGAASLGRLKPDILIKDADGKLRAVIDAKYKRLRSWAGSPSGVDRGDLYQLAAYLAGHDVPLGVLAYPPSDDDQAPAHSAGPWLTRNGQTARFERISVGLKEASTELSVLIGYNGGRHD